MAALIAYLRTAVRGGREDEPGVDAQREAVEAWAKTRRHRVVAVIEDDSPASRLEQRPGLVEAIAALRNGSADGLVLYRLDRLADDLVVQEQLVAEVRRLGARIFSLDPIEALELKRSPSDPSRRLVRRVLRAVAENEASMTALRAAASRNANDLSGSPPYGYRAEDGTLVPDPAEQATLARIGELRAAGATLREIARCLEVEGHRPKRAVRWHPESLRRIVDRLQAAD